MKKWKGTDFGKIPLEWDFLAVGRTDLHIGDGNYSSKYPRQNELLDSGVPFISSNDIVNGRISNQALRYISEKQHSTLLKGHINTDDVIIVVRGNGVGEVALVDQNYHETNINAQLAFLGRSKSISGKYLYYLLLDYYKKGIIDTIVSGSAQPQITVGSLKTLNLIIPQKEEQTLIAEILSSLDDKIDLLRRQNKTLEQLAETLFRQWFVEEAEEGWETKKISEVASINSRTISKNFPHTEIEYLDTGSITEGKIESFQCYLIKEAPGRAQRIVLENDIVYSVVRPKQRHYGLLHNVKPNTIVSTGFAVISCYEISPHFIYLLLTQNETVEYLDMIAEGSTSAYPSLKPSDIADLEFQLPSKKKLTAFHKIADNDWEKIKSNTNQIKTLTQLRDILLPKLMSGEVRVRN